MAAKLPMLLLRDLPRYECIEALARRFSDTDPRAVESCLLMLRVASDMLDTIERFLASRGLSQGRFTVLMLLLRHDAEAEGVCAGPAPSPSDLADRAGVTRATMTGLLDGLERDGFIARTPNPDDRRAQTVSLTPRGRELLESVLPGYFHTVSVMMNALAASDHARLGDLLRKLAASACPTLRNQAEPTPCGD